MKLMWVCILISGNDVVFSWVFFILSYFHLSCALVQQRARKQVHRIRVVYYPVVFMYLFRLERHISSSLQDDRKKCTNFACWFLRMIMMLIEVAVCPYFGCCLLILFTLRLKLARSYNMFIITIIIMIHPISHALVLQRSNASME